MLHRSSGHDFVYIATLCRSLKELRETGNYEVMGEYFFRSMDIDVDKKYREISMISPNEVTYMAYASSYEILRSLAHIAEYNELPRYLVKGSDGTTKAIRAWSHDAACILYKLITGDTGKIKCELVSESKWYAAPGIEFIGITTNLGNTYFFPEAKWRDKSKTLELVEAKRERMVVAFRILGWEILESLHYKSVNGKLPYFSVGGTREVTDYSAPGYTSSEDIEIVVSAWNENHAEALFNFEDDWDAEYVVRL